MTLLRGARPAQVFQCIDCHGFLVTQTRPASADNIGWDADNPPAYPLFVCKKCTPD